MFSLLLERLRNRNIIRDEKFFYLFAIILFFLQISVFIKLLTIHCIKPDLLLILLVFYTLNFPFYKSIKFAAFIGVLKDLINPSYVLIDVFVYILIVVFIFLLKRGIIFENIFLRLLLVTLVSTLFLILKSSILYLKSGFMPLDKNYLYFIFLNTIVFLFFNQFVENYKEQDEF
jgi:rod shape-determining protein MreD